MAGVVFQRNTRAFLLGLEGERFVQQAYLDCLDRVADTAGLNCYLAHLVSGMPKDVVIAELEASPEGQRVLLRRGLPKLAVDEGAHNSSDPVNLVRQGVEIAVPQRFQSVDALFSVSSDDEFLRAAYSTLLSRDVDPSGLVNYLAQLYSGTSRAQVIVELATSAEGQASGHVLHGLDALLAQVAELEVPAEVRHASVLLVLEPDAFLTAAYRAVLLRDADPEGIALYEGLLRQGWSRSYVLNELFLSEEGRGIKSSLAGLRALVKRYRRAQARTLFGWYQRSVKGAESDLPQDRALRAALLAAAR